MKRRLAAGLAALLLGTAIGTASAHSPADPDAAGNIARLSSAANLIFRGKVTEVRYRNAAAGRGAGAMPYTFVTFSIDAVLQGIKPGPKITLRFIGGADGRGGFVEAEGVPRFEVGDEDILFVTGNGEFGCPLVMCEFGRFRLLGGAVYEAHGAPVVSLSGNRVRAEGQAPATFQTFRYPAPSFDELLKRPEVAESIRKSGLTVAEARARYEAETVGGIEQRSVRATPDGAAETKAAAAPVTAGSFLAAVQAAIAQRGPRSLPAVQSIDPNAALAAPRAEAAPPPQAGQGLLEDLSPGPAIRKN